MKRVVRNLGGAGMSIIWPNLRVFSAQYQIQIGEEDIYSWVLSGGSVRVTGNTLRVGADLVVMLKEPTAPDGFFSFEVTFSGKTEDEPAMLPASIWLLLQRRTGVCASGQKQMHGDPTTVFCAAKLLERLLDKKDFPDNPPAKFDLEGAFRDDINRIIEAVGNAKSREAIFAAALASLGLN